MGEIKFPTKKQTVYLLCRKERKFRVKTAKGYVIDLTTNKGFTTKIALLCKGRRWFATHYETGMDCTPRTKATGEFEFSWKRDDLIARLKEIDFERCMYRDGKNIYQKYIDMIEEFKRGNKNE